jgi:hypothetical protein
MRSDVTLREMTEDDLSIFYEQQLDVTANYMAAFTPKDPAQGRLHNSLAQDFKR